MRDQLNVSSRFRAATTTTMLLIGAVVIAAGPAAAQSISGFSVSTSGSTGNSGNSGGATTSSVAIQINTATQVRSRFAWNVNADVGVGSTRDQSGNAQHNVAFNVTAPGSYFLTVATERTGALNVRNDLAGCNGAADTGGVTGGFSGGTLQAGGSLSLADPGGIGNTGTTTNTPFSQTASAQINRTSNGAAQAHTLTFTWVGSVRSNSCEAAVRQGETDGATSGCPACEYPGDPSRTQANDGHFQTVTLTNLCGNGVVDTSGTFSGITSEQCDQGVANGTATSCCTSTCQFRTAGQVCRTVAGVCDQQETCTGLSATCPADGFLSGATVCRGSAGVCDIAENCTGSSAPCPSDAFQPSSTVCRGSADVCDIAENCTGSSAPCPADAFQPSSTVCRGSAGVCDVAENCTGSGVACPADDFEPSSTTCRGAAGICDLAENCTGSGAACPGDSKSTAECRASAGICDLAEICDGVNDNCPADAKSVAECRAVAGVCDVAETCDGVGDDCPADSVSGAFVVCRAAGGFCDVPENCDGVGVDCPADAKTTIECRASAGVCDVAESCDGVNNNCPADAKSTAICRPDAGACDVADSCDGIGNDCPADVFEPNGTVCDNGDLCDVSDTCQTGVCISAGPDADADTVCDSADNCPTDANTGQEDLDSDTIGDTCDPSDGLLNPIKIQLRVTKAGSSDSSSLKASGDFVTLTGSDVFSAVAPITLTLGDGKPVPSTRTSTWQPADCRASATRVKCTSPDRLTKATFKTSPKAPTTWKFKATFKKQNLLGPVQGPTTAHLIYGPLTDRTGSIADCKSTATVLTCKDTQ